MPDTVSPIRTTGPVAIPATARPAEISDALDRYSALVIERNLAGEQDPPDERRMAAIRVLIADQRAVLTDLVATHKDTWTDALAQRIATDTKAYTDAIGALDQARADVITAARTLDWLDAAQVEPYRDAGQPVVFGERRSQLGGDGGSDDPTWPSILEQLYTDAIGERYRPATRIHRARSRGPRSIAHVTAAFPDLDRPKAIDTAYRHHHDLVERQAALTTERRQVEQTLDAAKQADTRAYADAIAAGERDPEDPNTRAVEDQLATLDAQRAETSTQVHQSYRDLLHLLDQHRATWRSTVAARHAAALDAYAQAVEALPTARNAMLTTQAHARWLAETTPTRMDRYRRSLPPRLNGQPYEVIVGLLRKDVARRRPAALATTSNDAA